FITNLVPINNSSQAETELNKIRKKYSDATHNCYAYISNIIATEQRFSDDGEPQGTAGIPMLEVLKKREVYLTLAVVTRYFGGVKLGANGLIGAYTESICNALEKADLRNFIYSTIQKAELSYSVAPKIIQMIDDFGGRVLSTGYDSNVTIEYAVEEEKSQLLSDKMIDLCAGKINIEFIKKDFVDYV
ncbi:MAG: YigZ family protein, partial [Clostridia bacterium]|nr:YigZ family protein [Clostridia bacterium]